MKKQVIQSFKALQGWFPSHVDDCEYHYWIRCNGLLGRQIWKWILLAVALLGIVWQYYNGKSKERIGRRLWLMTSL